MVLGDISFTVFSCMSITPSTKSTKLERLIDEILLYMRAKIGELWLRESPLDAKILKGIK